MARKRHDIDGVVKALVAGLTRPREGVAKRSLTGTGAALVGTLGPDGRMQWKPVGRPIETQSVPPKGSWLAVDGFNLIEGPDRQLWVELYGVYPDKETAERRHPQKTPFDGVPDGVDFVVVPIDESGPEDAILTGPTVGRETIAKFWDRTWLLVLDANGDAIS